MIVETLEDWPQRSVVLNKSSPNFICTILCKSRFNGQQVCLQIRVRVPICITSLKLKVPTNASSRKQKGIFQIGPTRSSNICIKFIFCLFPHLSLKDGRGWVGMGVWDWGSCIRSHRSPFVSEIFNVSRIKNEFLKFVKFGCNEIF